jgi:hypothetical protein
MTPDEPISTSKHEFQARPALSGTSASCATGRKQLHTLRVSMNCLRNSLFQVISVAHLLKAGCATPQSIQFSCAPTGKWARSTLMDRPAFHRSGGHFLDKSSFWTRDTILDRGQGQYQPRKQEPHERYNRSYL